MMEERQKKNQLGKVKMSFSYYNMKKRPRDFHNITGLTIEEFEVEKVGSGWEKLEEQKRCNSKTSNSGR